MPGSKKVLGAAGIEKKRGGGVDQYHLCLPTVKIHSLFLKTANLREIEYLEIEGYVERMHKDPEWHVWRKHCVSLCKVNMPGTGFLWPVCAHKRAES